MKNRRLPFILAAGAAFVLAGFLISQAMMSSMVFYYPVKEVVEQPDLQKYQNVRVSGLVKPGTIERSVDRREIAFTAIDRVDHNVSIRVVHKNLDVPDMFKDHAEVVAEGNLQAAGHFESTFIMAKCPSKYETQYKETGVNPHEVAGSEGGYGSQEAPSGDGYASQPVEGVEAVGNSPATGSGTPL